MFRVINILQISSGIHRSQARTWNTTSWHQELYNRANNGLFWAKPRLHCHQGSILTLWLHWCGIFGRKNSLKTPLFVLTSSVSRFNWFRFVKSNANYKIYRLNLSLEICFLFIASLIISLYSPTAEKQRPKGKFFTVRINGVLSLCSQGGSSRKKHLNNCGFIMLFVHRNSHLTHFHPNFLLYWELQ